MSRSIIVLADTCSGDEVDAFAATRGWQLISEHSRSHFILASRRYLAEEAVEVTYLEDHTGDVRFLSVAAPHESPTVAAIAGNLPSISAEMLLAEAAQATTAVECIRSLSRLAVCRPQIPDQRWLDVWARMLAHPETAVRRAAIRTSYSCSWPQQAALLESALKTEQRLGPQIHHLLKFLADV